MTEKKAIKLVDKSLQELKEFADNCDMNKNQFVSLVNLFISCYYE